MHQPQLVLPTPFKVPHYYYYYLSLLLLLLFTHWKFFSSVLADGFSVDFEWQQVSFSQQDSFQYSGRSQ